MERRCEHCGEVFIPLTNVARQRYCSKADCQKARRNQWRKRKLLHAIRTTGAISMTRKRGGERATRGTGSRYRASHPDYVERNRALQRERNHRRRGALIAKRDELRDRNPMRSGYYRLIWPGEKGLQRATSTL